MSFPCRHSISPSARTLSITYLSIPFLLFHIIVYDRLIHWNETFPFYSKGQQLHLTEFFFRLLHLFKAMDSKGRISKPSFLAFWLLTPPRKKPKHFILLFAFISSPLEVCKLEIGSIRHLLCGSWQNLCFLFSRVSFKPEMMLPWLTEITY